VEQPHLRGETGDRRQRRDKKRIRTIAGKGLRFIGEAIQAGRGGDEAAPASICRRPTSPPLRNPRRLLPDRPALRLTSV